MQATWVSMATVVAQLLGTNVATDCGLDTGHPCGLWWHHGPQTSTIDPGHGESQTQTDMGFMSIPGLNVTIV